MTPSPRDMMIHGGERTVFAAYAVGVAIVGVVLLALGLIWEGRL